MLLTAIVIFLFGLIVGSFLNVVSLRLNTGMSIVSGRSQCFSCGQTLRWYELIPLFSFVALRGACRTCRTPISWQYPLVEVITGLLFVALYIRVGLAPFLLYYMGIVSVLIVIAVYDLRHKIIPDILSLILVIATALVALVPVFAGEPGAVWDILAGPLLATPFAALWFFSKGRWIGLGDAKLVIGLGCMLGLAQGLSAIVIAFWIGAAWSVSWILASRLCSPEKRLTMKSEIPFGPFLIAGALLVFFFGWNVMGL